jgi:hypothetical protein
MSDRSPKGPLDLGTNSRVYGSGVSAGPASGSAHRAEGSLSGTTTWAPEWDEVQDRQDKQRRAAALHAELSAAGSISDKVGDSWSSPPARRDLASDEIDLRDLIKFVWGLRLYLVAGAALGAAAGFVLPGRVVPLKYRTQIPIRLDVKSLPALSDPKQLVDALNSVLATSEADQTFHQSFARAFPSYADRYGSSDRSVEGASEGAGTSGNPASLVSNVNHFMRSPFQAGVSKNVKDIPIRVEAALSREQFIASVELPFQTFDEAALSGTVVSALNTIIDAHNKRTAEIYSIQNNAQLDDRRVAQENALESMRAGGRLSREELQRVAIEIHRFSYRYLSLIPSLPESARSLLARTDIPNQDDGSELVSLRTPSRMVFEKAAANLAQSVTIVSLLAETGQIDAQQVKSFQETYQSLQFELSRVFAEVQTQQEMTSRVAQEYAATAMSALTPINREQTFLPLMERSRPLASAASSAGGRADVADAERPSPSPRMLLAAFTLLGVLIMGFLGAALTFVRRTDWS